METGNWLRLLPLYILLISSLQVVFGGKPKYSTPHVTLMAPTAAASQQVPQLGYLYPIPAGATPARSQLKFPAVALPRPSSTSVIGTDQRLPSASAQEPSVLQQFDASGTSENLKKSDSEETEVIANEQDPGNEMEEIDTTTDLPGTTLLVPSGRSNVDTTRHHHHHHPVIDSIDVACGKEKMMVRVSFDAPFDGIIYAKGYYTDAKCRFVSENSGQAMYIFELTTGECGVSFIDEGLREGGQAFVEGLLVIIYEPGVQEAWDASRKIRCLWEGNLEQTVTFPLSVNVLEQKILTFSGDTASVALEIQVGDGPRSAPVQGLVRIGDMLTAVVTVQGDADFDLLVRNCVATDGTSSNRIILSDTRGCATKPKLMGGWSKEKTGVNGFNGNNNTAGVLSYARLSAFKFPDVMDLFLECTVSLCKGHCQECPSQDYLELLIPNVDDEDDIEVNSLHDEEDLTTLSPTTTPSTTTILPVSTTLPPTTTSTTTIKPINNLTEALSSASVRFDVRIKSQPRGGAPVSKKIRPRRSIRPTNEDVQRNPPQESLQLRRVVHVVGPDDFPQFSTVLPSPTIYGLSPNHNGTFSNFDSRNFPVYSSSYSTYNEIPMRSSSPTKIQSDHCFSTTGVLVLASTFITLLLCFIIFVAIFGCFRNGKKGSHHYYSSSSDKY